MLFEKIGIINKSFNYIPECYVGVKGDKIEYVGKEKPSADYGESYNGKGKLLMPGLYNVHSHGVMTLLRGYAESMHLQDWLYNKIFPFEAKLLPDDYCNGLMLAYAEMLRFGVVSSSEMYFQFEHMAKAVIESGIKSNLSVSVMCFDDSDLSDLPIYKEMKDSIKLVEALNNSRLKMDLSLHAEYTSNPKIAAQMAELARETGLVNHIHLAETESEVKGCKEKYGKTPVEYFSDIGMLDTPVNAAHCVWLEENDYAIMAEKGVTAITNPASNLKLASGICDVQKLLNSGINVTIGTDGPASNNALNLLSDLKTMAIASKVKSGDAAVVSPEDALRIATVNGAKAQRRDNCGALKVGNKADLIVLDIDTPWMTPCHSMINNVVYSAQGSDVVLTMVDGKVLYKDGEYTTIDIEKVKFNADKSVKEILARL